MFNNLNIKTQGDLAGEINKGGVFNEFVAPISDEAIHPKKDSIKIILIVVLIITILLAIGSILYTNILKNEVEKQKQILNSFDSSQEVIYFEKSLNDMRGLSQRLKLINSVYDSRLYISGMLFPVLESVVESSRDSYVYFNKFSVKKENSSSLASVSISGLAIDYPTLYRQLNNFKNTKEISNFKLTGFSLDDSGNVLFDVSFLIDISTPSYIKYVKSSIANYEGSGSQKVNGGPLFKTINNSASTSSTTLEAVPTTTKVNISN